VVLIDALYINTGGAKVILDSIIFELSRRKILENYYFLLDDRLSFDSYALLGVSNFTFLKPSLISRFNFYNKNINCFSKIVCLANLPPPIKIINVPVFIFFHNAHIIQPNLSFVKVYALFKYRFKWLFLLYKNKPYYNWIVQTNTMFDIVRNGLFIKDSKIRILSFFNDESYLNLNQNTKSNVKCFVYVADGQPQKNHLFLLQAWKILFDKYDIKTKLILTVSNAYPKLIFKINRLREAGLNIENLGLIQHENMLKVYNSVDYLIYPSLIESFGLPLIEAASLGCDVIAIEKKYVSDVIKPSSSFSESRVSDLVEIIKDICNGGRLPKTEILIKNRMNDFIELIA
jgi:hypothetical protein